MQETIVLYPGAGIGHIVSMVELAKKLLSQLPQHSFTILLTTGFLDHPSIDAYIQRISTSHPSISFLRFTPDPVNASTTLSFAAKAFEFIRNNVTNVTSTLTRISQTSTIRAFIMDIFCSSAMSMVSSMGIPVYNYFPTGATALAMFSYFPVIHHQTSVSLKDLAQEIHIPGNPPIKAHRLPEALLDREDPAYVEMLYCSTHLPKSDGILVNTFKELESTAVKVIQDGLCFPDPKQRPPVYYIGPLIAEPTDSQQSQSTDAIEECFSWLDKQPSRSVVFLCFGSLGVFSEAQLKEIADGLERSGHRFLWIVKRPKTQHNSDEGATGEFNLSSVLPSGFVERTKDRGMVMKSWAPQVDVLSRESVGAFVTHCGWNSLLEGVVAGVPMIAWPLYAEQYVNANAMVKEMKVAVGVEQREEDGFVSGEEVEKKVREVMESEKGREVRETSLKMKEFALAAFEEGGSSKIALAHLVQGWTQ